MDRIALRMLRQLLKRVEEDRVEIVTVEDDISACLAELHGEKITVLKIGYTRKAR